jgi:hypothetical protein
MICAIPDGDNLFRSVVHPLAFRKKGKQLDRGKFFHLCTDDLTPGLIKTSVVWERYAPTSQRVHAFGCRLAVRMNEANPKTRHVYCGAYQFKASNVRQLVGTENLAEVVGSDVLHVIEHGEIAHANIQIRLAADVDEDSVEGIKTVIVDRLWQSNRGPIPHICDVDTELEPPPSQLLIDAPNGTYSDDRSSMLRFWYDVRFAALYSLWRMTN